MEKIALIYMGGTFGCIGQPLYPMPASQFIEKLKNIGFSKSFCTIDYFAAPVIKDSSELYASDWIELSLFIQSLQENQGYQYFIVIHGTDTLSYAGAFLHHIFSNSIHLIITGSQYPLLDNLGEILHSNSDASDNLNFAIQHIYHNAGVYLAFDQQLYHANTCYKLDTQNPHAFLGLKQTYTYKQNSLNLRHFVQQQDIDAIKNIRVLNYYLLPNSVEQIAKQLISIATEPPNILILQTFGTGNLPYSPELKTILQNLIAKGCWVVISSQVLYGALQQHYATGSWLTDLALVFDPHYSQADLYARAILLYLQYHQHSNWQQFWLQSKG